MKTKIQNHSGDVLEVGNFDRQTLKQIELLRKRYNGTGRIPYINSFWERLSLSDHLQSEKVRFKGYYVTWVYIKDDESIISLRRKGGKKK